MYQDAEFDQAVTNSRFSARVLTTLSILSWLIVLWTFNAARYLRPVADDYCIGVRGTLGPIGGFINDWMTWSGFVTPSFLTNLLVGIPIANGPLWIASSLTFVCAALSIAFMTSTFYAAANGLSNSLKKSIMLLFLFTPIAVVAWWTFLWFPVGMSTETPFEELAVGLTHWQNLNSAYVIPTALLVGTWALLYLRLRERKSWSTFAVAMLALFTGLMGPTFAMAAIVTIALITFWRLLSPAERNGPVLRGIIVPVTAITVGLAIAYISPGTQERASVFETKDVALSANSAVGWLMGIAPESLANFGELLFHWGALIVFLLFSGLGFFSTQKFPKMNVRQLLPISVVLTIFGISLSSATIITDELSYGAYWHSSSIAVVAFSVCVTVGAWAGSLLSRLNREPTVLVASLSLFVSVVAMLGSSLDVSESIVEREAIWREGPAPISGILEDREVEWIGNCAIQLKELNPVF